MNATGAIIGSTVIITGLSVMKDVHLVRDPVKPVVSGFLLGSALLLVAFISPRLAKAFALMGVVGAFLVNGNDAFAILGKVGA